MAEVVKLIVPAHPCSRELDREFGVGPPQHRRIDPDRFGLGTEVKCSCGQYYVLREDQRDGRYWSPSGSERE